MTQLTVAQSNTEALRSDLGVIAQCATGFPRCCATALASRAMERGAARRED